MAQADDDWGVRLADVRVPSWYGIGALALVLAALIGELRKRKAWGEATRSATEALEAVSEWMVKGDRRDDRVAELTEHMAAMTGRMESYGRTSVSLARASLVVATTALIVAIVAVIACTRQAGSEERRLARLARRTFLGTFGSLA